LVPKCGNLAIANNHHYPIRLVNAYHAWPIIAAVVCLSTATVSGNAAPSGGLADGLDGYWTFSETSGGILHDSSGHGYNGTLVNYPLGQGNWTPSPLGGALLFGGTSAGQIVRVSTFAMPTTSMTLSAWVQANSIPRWATIAANWNGAWGAFNYGAFSNTRNLSLYVADGGNPPSEVNVDYGVSSASLSLNEWHFVAFVADSSTHTVTFMQDGIAAGSFNYHGQLFASSSQLTIGGDQGFWDGKIDDLAIWTRALSSQELGDIYNAGLAGQPLSTLVPEPSAMAMVSLGLLTLVGIRIRHGLGRAGVSDSNLLDKTNR
jgi:hypothetical protein